MKRLACALLSVSACARRDDATIAPVPEQGPRTEVVAKDALPIVRSRADLRRNDGRRVVVEGRYEIDPVPAGKKAQPAFVVLVDGARVIRSYRPVREELAFADRRVRVTGTVTVGPPDARVQAMSGPHVQAERVELAAGEAAITPAPSVVPAPPMVTTLPGFAPYLDRFVAVSGTLDAVTPRADPAWADARVRLSDGGVVLVEYAATSRWAPLAGKTITTLGRVAVLGRDAGLGLDVKLEGASGPCAGVEPRCAMDR